MPYESFPPFAIIVGAITAMGGVQYLVHHVYEGKPKAAGQDNFDSSYCSSADFINYEDSNYRKV